MAKYTQISNGSSGSDVRTAQELLKQNGYNLTVDGIFGAKTEAAVRDYQKKNGLTVDGIVGTNTWGALTKPADTTTKTTDTTKTTNTEFTYEPYQQSDAVTKA